MNLTITPAIRIVAVIGLVATVALGGSIFMLGRSHSTAGPAAGQRHGSATPAQRAATPATHATPTTAVTTPATSVTPAKRAPKVTAAQKAAATHKAAVAHQAAVAHEAAVAHKAVLAHKAALARARANAKFRGNPVYASLPAPLQWELAHHKVVVVSFYNPNAETDTISVAEAHAGATAAGAGFLLVSVLDDKVAGILTALLPDGGLLPQPGVIIYRAPGAIAVRMDGFADRDSVAQAANNALTAQVAVSTTPPDATAAPASATG
jgi:hypothetical protein